MTGNLQFDNERSPIADMDHSFRTYLDRHICKNNAKHISGSSVPDYAYDLDHVLRRKLERIPGLHSLAMKLYATVASNALQELDRNAVAVSPTRFPEVYDMACDCALRLGMAVPRVYIANDPTACIRAFYLDNVQPMIKINSALYEKTPPEELKVRIGRECGHIQNDHVVYWDIANTIFDAGINDISGSFPALAAILSQGTMHVLYSWSRAAEITADRAGLICGGSNDDRKCTN